MSSAQNWISAEFRDLYFLGDFAYNGAHAFYANGFQWWTSQGWRFTNCYFNNMFAMWSVNPLTGGLGGDSLKCVGCKAQNIYGFVFNMNNEQSLNNEFVECDFEEVYGNIYNVTINGGGALRVYGGSHIMTTTVNAAGPNAFIAGTPSGMASTSLVVASITSGFVTVGSWINAASGIPVAGSANGACQIIAQQSGMLGNVGTYTLNQSVTVSTGTALTTTAYLLSIANVAEVGDYNNTYTFDGLQTQLEAQTTCLCYCGPTGGNTPIITFNNVNDTETTGTRLTVNATQANITFNNCVLGENQDATFQMMGPAASGAQYGNAGSIVFNQCEVVQSLSALCLTPGGADGLPWGYISARNCSQSAFLNLSERYSRYATDFDLNWQNTGRSLNGMILKRTVGKSPNYAWPNTANTYWTVLLPTLATIVRITVYRAANIGANVAYNLYCANGGTIYFNGMLRLVPSTVTYGMVTGSNCNVSQLLTGMDWFDTPASWVVCGTLPIPTFNEAPSASNLVQIYTTDTATAAEVGNAGYFIVEYY